MNNVKFKNFIKLNRGFDLPNDKMIFGDYPVVASTSIKGFHNTFKVKAPCVVTGRSGSLGTVQYITKDCIPLNTTLYVKDFKGNNPKYVYYYLKTMHLEAFNSGAGVPTLNQNHLHNINIKVHDYSTQEKVANTLSVYDNLIENNNRRIELLENATQDLYKEWFVRFRFPGYKETKFKKGLPVGWEVKKVGEICSNIFSGGTPSTSIKEYWDGENYWLSSGETRNKRIYRTDKTITKLGVDNSSTKLAKVNDLVMACAGQGKTRGQLSIIMRDMYVNQSVIVIRIKDEFCVQYAFENLKSRYDELRSVSDASSIRGSITTDLLKKTKILMPNIELLIKYSNFVSPILKELEILENNNQNLIKQRDLLLPRLMSGKLRV